VAKLPKGLYQRGSIFWTKVYQHGRPLYQGTGTSNLTEAKRIRSIQGQSSTRPRPETTPAILTTVATFA